MGFNGVGMYVCKMTAMDQYWPDVLWPRDIAMDVARRWWLVSLCYLSGSMLAREREENVALVFSHWNTSTALWLEASEEVTLFHLILMMRRKMKALSFGFSINRGLFSWAELAFKSTIHSTPQPCWWQARSLTPSPSAWLWAQEDWRVDLTLAPWLLAKWRR